MRACLCVRVLRVVRGFLRACDQKHDVSNCGRGGLPQLSGSGIYRLLARNINFGMQNGNLALLPEAEGTEN